MESNVILPHNERYQFYSQSQKCNTSIKKILDRQASICYLLLLTPFLNKLRQYVSRSFGELNCFKFDIILSCKVHVGSRSTSSIIGMSIIGMSRSTILEPGLAVVTNEAASLQSSMPNQSQNAVTRHVL